jgi:hypothetical protein
MASPAARENERKAHLAEMNRKNAAIKQERNAALAAKKRGQWETKRYQGKNYHVLG